MPDISFPDLSTKVARENFHEPPPQNASARTIRDDFEGGQSHTRPRFTRRPRAYEFSYILLPEADKLTLDDFINNIVFGDALSFLWYHPITGDLLTVRFVGEDYDPEYLGWGGDTTRSLWQVKLKVEEV
jgi:hypothetical protein